MLECNMVFSNICSISGLGLTIFSRLRPHSIWRRLHYSLVLLTSLLISPKLGKIGPRLVQR